jgi:tetratricopeptide (TPR) repeat protein
MLKLAEVPSDQRASYGDATHLHPRRRRQHLYYAFLSYSHKDQEAADWLHEELEGFKVPRALAGRLTENGIIPKQLKPIFRDRHELAAADDLGEEIREALDSSRFLIVLCSPDAAKSRWTNAEIEAFKRSHPDGGVLAVIVAGEPFASDVPGFTDLECFPPALTHKYDRRGRATEKRVEPLAADLRETGDGRRMGFLKLVAGMLGVGLDELVHREAIKRHRRMAWLAAASIAGMGVTSSLAITAIQARDSARDQRREAEGLVAFMVGDLKDKLEPIGRLDALDGVGGRVLAYYSKQDTSELSDAALVQRSRALGITGQVAQLRGDLKSARRLYSEAAAGTAEAVRRNPDDPQRIWEHAQNIFQIGELARDSGQTDQAVAAYSEYKRLADRLVAIEPDNLKWRMEGFYGVENTGISLYNKRRYSEAARQFEGALLPMQNLAAIDPGNVTYQKELAVVLGWVAQAQWVLGNLDTAIAQRQKQVSFIEGQLTGQSRNVLLRQQLVPAHLSLGLLFTQRGQTERGIEEFRSGLAEANRLISIEPDNSRWRDGAVAVQLELARNLLATGQREEAAQQISIACQVTIAQRARNPGVARWRMHLTNCLDRRSRLALASGSTPDALAFAEQALASARTERNEDPVTDRYHIAASSRLLGDIRRRAGDEQGAKAAWSAGLAQLPLNVAERPSDMNERAELMRRLGHADEARPLADRLIAMGFRSVT